MSWTDDRVDFLRRLVGKGLSASQMADELGGVSRNAVISKIHRSGMVFSARIGKPKQGPKMRTHPFVDRKPPKLKPVEATDLPPEPVANPVTLMQLTAHTCRWPVDMPSGPMMYCGAGPAYGKSYCAHHCRQAFAGYGQAMSRAERELALRASRKAKAA